MLEIGPLRREDMPLLLDWRNASPGAWRDPVATTISRQNEWFDTTVSHEDWIRGAYEGGFLIAQTQLYPIDWHNKSAEIGLIVDPKLRGHGLGKKIVHMTLSHGFRELGLNTIWGEVYKCTDAWQFWSKVCPNLTTMPQRKCWESKYWDSLYFWWVASEWEGK